MTQEFFTTLLFVNVWLKFEIKDDNLTARGLMKEEAQQYLTLPYISNNVHSVAHLEC